VLKENIDMLHALAGALLEREILDGEEIDKLMRGEQLPPVGVKKNGQPEQAPAPQGGGDGNQPAGDQRA
jgi:cell division protease FtsH